MRTKMHRQGRKANMAMLAVIMAIVTIATVPTIHVQAQKIWPVQMDDVTMRQYYNAIVSDFRNGYNSNWSGPRNKTYLVNDTASCVNFYGQSDYVSLILNSVQTELAGMDYYLGDTSAVNGATRLKNMISSNKDTIYLHFAIFSTDNASHTIYTFNEPLTSIQFSTSQTGRVVSEDGASSYYVREFERDGSWHEYFVPMSEFASILAQSVGSGATTGTDMSADDMIVSITTVGEAGNMLNLDAIFFCDESMKQLLQPDDTTVVEHVTGTCGDSAMWVYDATYKTLVVTGTGNMWDYMEVAPEYSDYSQQIETVAVSEGIRSVGVNAFADFANLTTAVLSNTVTEVREGAFSSCGTLKFLSTQDGLTTIGQSAFSNCDVLESVVFPSTMTSIGVGAFSGCSGLQYITSEAINPPTLGQRAFYNVPTDIPLYVPEESMGVYNTTDGWSEFKNIQAIGGNQGETFQGECGDSVQWILETESGLLSIMGTGAMWNYGEEMPAYSEFMQAVRYVNIEDGVTSVGDNAFNGFTVMEEAMLPENVASIGISAFNECYSLHTIVCRSVTPPAIAGNMVFNGVSEEAQVLVPSRSLAAYRKAIGWGDYFKNIEAFDGDTVVEETTVTVFGVVITPGDSTSTEPIDILGDSTLVYDPVENTITFSGVDWEVGDSSSVALNYTGSETLTIVLNDSSTILADTVIASTADIVITGEGKLVAEGTVPIIGTPTATITFDSVNMHVRSVPSAQALRHRIKSGKRLDETGGPALSGFGSADFNKTNVTPSDASYGPVTTTDENGEETTTNALYTTNEDGEQEVVTEFELTAQSDKTGVVNTRTQNGLDKDKPMYNVLGVQVGTDYHGVVIQNGEKYLLK
ncbi:MAG: leucine-rich repeat domain-containing protein [Paludibacteraceae bacterium]|nr:leucine-rich repeat domain-containing protein [Paludibacteraceae bacterium]